MTRTEDHLAQLVAFDTVSDRSNLALIDYVETHLQDLGFAVARVSDPSEPKAGLFASIGPPGAGVLLSAHTDVVPVDGQTWTKDPFRLTPDGDRLYGRGTTDMKGFLAAMLALAERAATSSLIEPLKFAISYDEEIGCVGIARMIDGLVPSIGLPRACIVGEPTGMRVAIGHKGKQAFKAICHGTAGHSALAPRFTNALHVATDFVGGLRDFQQELERSGARDDAYDVPFSTVHVGRLTGGTALNIVPDLAKVLCEFRHVAGDDSADLTRRIEGIAACAGGLIELVELNRYPGLATNSDATVVAFARSLTESDDITKVAFGTEAGFFDALGIPTVVCGPGSMEGQGHKADEFITRSDLAACDAMLGRLLDTLCGRLIS